MWVGHSVCVYRDVCICKRAAVCVCMRASRADRAICWPLPGFSTNESADRGNNPSKILSEMILPRETGFWLRSLRKLLFTERNRLICVVNHDLIVIRPRLCIVLILLYIDYLVYNKQFLTLNNWALSRVVINLTSMFVARWLIWKLLIS